MFKIDSPIFLQNINMLARQLLLLFKKSTTFLDNPQIYLDIFSVQTQYLKGTLYRTKRIHFFIDFSSAQPATVLGDPDFSITVHDFGKMQNTSPTGC